MYYTAITPRVFVYKVLQYIHIITIRKPRNMMDMAPVVRPFCSSRALSGFRIKPDHDESITYSGSPASSCQNPFLPIPLNRAKPQKAIISRNVGVQVHLPWTQDLESLAKLAFHVAFGIMVTYS